MKNNKLFYLFTGLLFTALMIVFFSDFREEKSIQTVISAGQESEPNALPNEWMAKQRSWPHDNILTASYREAMQHAASLHKKSALRSYDWQLLGPTNIGGRITDIAVDPLNQDIWYIGGATGGIFKTNNAGENWENIFLDEAVISIGDLAIDPSDSQVIYAGTGEANASSYSFYGNGVYKSTDGGLNWEHSGLENSVYIGRMIVDYDNPQRVWAAAAGSLFTPDEYRGVYRSLDGGNNWEKVLFLTDSTSAIDLVQHPENPDIIYASMWERMRGRNYRNSFGESSGIYKSIDGGDSWEEITNGLPGGNDVGRIGIAIAESNPNILYAFYDMPSSEVRVYRSDDGGTSWTRKNDNTLYGMNSTFGWYFGQVRVDPSNEDRVYVLGVYAYRSDNGGDSWYEMGNYNFHVDHHALYIDPDASGFCLEGNDGGFYRSDDFGNNWAKINNLPLTQFYAIEIDQNIPSRIYGGTQDNNTIRTPGGQLDDWEVLLGGDGFYCLVDYTNPDIIYAEYQWGALHKSTDGGYSFDFIGYPMYNDRKNWSAPFVMHPQYPQTLYFGSHRIWKTTNGGSQWTAVSNDLTDGDDGSTFHTVSTIAISALNPDIIVAGTDDGHVHISTDASSSWTEISDGLPRRWITRVATDPFEENTIYVSLSGFRWDEPYPHIFMSEDLGQSWQPVSGNLPQLPVNIIIPDPQHPGHIFAGTDAGVFFTSNYGQDWIGISAGLGNVAVTAMDIYEPDRSLVVGTYGISAYKINIDDITVGIENQSELIEKDFVSIFPNPWNPATNTALSLSFDVDVSSSIRLQLLDVNARQLGKKSIMAKKGTTVLELDKLFPLIHKLYPSAYFIRMDINDKTISRKFIIQ